MTNYNFHSYKEPKKCVVCGKSFMGKAPNAKFCSVNCRTKEGWIPKNYPKKKCEYCGKIFKPRCQHHILCSTECRKLYRKKGLNVSRINTREYFLEKFYFICEKCKKQFNPNQLDVHHIVPFYRGGDDVEKNICLLCRKCHREFHKII